MTKRFMNVTLDNLKSDFDGMTLAQMKLKIDELISVYGTDAYIDIGQESEDYSYSGQEYAYVKLIGRREETDKEYEHRTNNEARIAERNRVNDLAQLALLQKKYGS